MRDFLLEEGGIKQLQTTIASDENVEGYGQNIVKELCLRHIRAWVDLNGEHSDIWPGYFMHSDSKPRTDKMPFLGYATRNVIHHANQAERWGVKQRRFLKDFPLTIG